MAKKVNQDDFPYSYNQDVDIFSTLKQIAVDLRDKYNDKQEFASLKGKNFCDIKMTGTQDGEFQVQFIVNQVAGSWRTANPADYKRKYAEMTKAVEKFVKEVRKEFKERTGKALKLSGKRTDVASEMVSMNDLHRFFAICSANVKTVLDAPDFQDEG